MTTKTLTAPTVNLGGTARTELMDRLTEADDALRAAIAAIQATAPNGRDYHPQGPGVIVQATREHRDRLTRIQSVLDEIRQLAESVAG